MIRFHSQESVDLPQGDAAVIWGNALMPVRFESLTLKEFNSPFRQAPVLETASAEHDTVFIELARYSEDDRRKSIMECGAYLCNVFFINDIVDDARDHHAPIDDIKRIAVDCLRV